MSLSYVGAAGRNLYYTTVVANPNASFIGDFALGTNKGASDYDALQVQFKRRLNKGLELLSSYTWAHSIDNASDYGYGSQYEYGVPVPNYNPNQDRGPSDFDVRHTFTLAAHYDIPTLQSPGWTKQIFKGWSVDPVFRAQSALPQYVYSLSIIQGVYVYARPDLVPGQPLYLYGSGYPGGKAFNPAAVSAVNNRVTQLSQVQQGTLPRNYFRGFSHYEPDLSIARRFSITERIALQFRADFFNLFNTPQFSNPNQVVGQPTFGLVTQPFANSLNGIIPIYQFGGPRSIQMSAKFMF